MNRIPYLEHCPECRPAVKCPPLTLRTTDEDSIVGQYRCSVCLFSWRTWWQREPATSRGYQ